ncbi:MAG: phosphatase PAP2 family protein [Peptococcaceae bacterium]|jgi:undecaprenyl-diphosphatase|nr:phosphatase PAP2 family protein [Peptococcaceae bacterium]
MNPFDVWLFYRINHFAGVWPVLDRVMILFAQYGIFAYAVLMILAWFALPRRDENQRHALVTAALAGLLALAVNWALGLAWFRPRPFVVLPRHTFTQLIAHAPDNSFPSDHAAGAFAFAAGSWGRTPRWITVTFTVLAVIIAVARVFVGVHWPTDVLAGMVVGILSGRILAWAEPLFRPLTALGLRIFRYGDFTPSPRRFR